MPTTCPIIPVLDLMIGQIVLATGGNRDAYQPVDSKLTRSSEPLDVAKAMFSQTGCDCLYLADIDSFSGAEPNWAVYNTLLDAGFGLWIDADWVSRNHADRIEEKIKSPARLKIILSSETMTSLSDFERLEQWISGGLTPIFSLDKKTDTVITRPGEMTDASSLEWIQHAYQHGVRDFIVLDLSSVGTMRGIEASPDDSLAILVQEIRGEFPDTTLISGGGIRDVDDAKRLMQMGCQHVLVATAIHDRRFTPDDVTALGRRLGG
jgi:phosphoribosylformimino-5-aminoimidazole carboxamide ribotide isomerase